MSTRGRAGLGLHVGGRKRRAKVWLGKKGNAIERKLRELQRRVPESHGMEVKALFQTIQNYIILLEAKVSILRSLSTLYGV